MRSLRVVGSLKLYVSFAEYRLFYRALLQLRPIIWRSLLIVATPYKDVHWYKEYMRTCMNVCVCMYMRICVFYSFLFTCVAWLVVYVCHDSFWSSMCSDLFFFVGVSWLVLVVSVFWLYIVNFTWELRPATHCNTLQNTATHCNSLQHTATRPHVTLMVNIWIALFQ